MFSLFASLLPLWINIVSYACYDPCYKHYHTIYINTPIFHSFSYCLLSRWDSMEKNGRFRGISGRKIFWFFRCLPVKFLLFPVGNGQKSPEKSDDLLARNTASVYIDFRDFSAGTGDFPELSSRFRCFSEAESPSWVSFPLPLMHNDFICTQKTSFFLSGVCFLCIC